LDRGRKSVFISHPSKGTSMTDCPNCEYHRKRAQLWREEAYKQAGHPLPERGWVGLTDEEILKNQDIVENSYSLDLIEFAKAIEAKLKEKNNG